MNSRKMLMTSGHCRVMGLSDVLISCDAQKAASAWFSSVSLPPFIYSDFPSSIGFLFLCILFLLPDVSVEVEIVRA